MRSVLNTVSWVCREATLSVVIPLLELPGCCRGSDPVTHMSPWHPASSCLSLQIVARGRNLLASGEKKGFKLVLERPRRTFSWRRAGFAGLVVQR